MILLELLLNYLWILKIKSKQAGRFFNAIFQL